MRKKQIGLFLGPIAFCLIRLFFHSDELGDNGNAVLASTLWIAIWWVTEALPIEVTSLMPLILFPLTGAMELKETGSAYGHKFIFLFIGGFTLAIAIEKWKLHQRIALNIIHLVGRSLDRILLGFMLSTALLSMWISNTATTVMMLPIATAILLQFSTGNDAALGKKFGKALMLGIAYSASIGGMATLIGTPPNLIFAGIVQELYQTEITFLQWMKIGLPISLLLLILCWLYLSKFAFKLNCIKLEEGPDSIGNQLTRLGKMSREEKLVLTVFICTALAWISRSFVLKSWIPAIDDSIIALIAAVVLFVIPSKKGEKLMDWKDAVQLPWGILLLFGGGIALAMGFEQSGLAAWIGSQLKALAGIPMLLILVLVVAAVNFLTEITSNIATTAILLPILAAMSTLVNIHPYVLLTAATLAASCAFMLPVATAPNALVFGSGRLKMDDMMRNGFGLNLISIFIITLFAYLLFPLMWDLL